MSNNQNPAVIIAGGGPTGLTAALELKRFGIPVRIVDEMEGPSATSRAIAIQARTLEELELRGLADEFLRLGHRIIGVDIYGEGKLLTRVDFSKIPSRYDYILVLPQTETERILREALEAEGAAVEWGVKMIAFGQEQSHITTVLEHTNGSLEDLKCPYIIGAEGAHSIVRNSLGLEFKGKTLDQNFALGDVHIDGNLPNTDLHIFSSEQGFLGLFPMGGSLFRIVASIRPADPPASEAPAEVPPSDPPTLEQLQAFYNERSHITARLHQMTWSSWFHINSRMVDRLKIGRVFLAGDAAHIHSPAGGQGMNSGIQDAINLCWKIALVLNGRAPESLLDTYDQDRIPVMRSILSKTEGLTDVIAGGQSAMRSFFIHLAPWFGNIDFVQEGATGRISQIALNYRSSPLSDDHFAEGSVIAGDRVPDFTVRVSGAAGEASGGEGESRRLFELLNPSRFTLLLANFAEFTSSEAQIARTPAQWQELEAKISSSIAPWHDLIDVVHIAPLNREVAKPFQELFGSRASITLVRPDAYVGFRGNETAPLQLADYCKRWLTPAAEQQAA